MCSFDSTSNALCAAVGAALTLALAAACGRDERDDTAAATVPAPGTTTATSHGIVTTIDADTDLGVESLTLGRGVGADGQITDATDEFGSADTIVAVVETDDDAAGQQLVARWTYGANEQLVAEQTQAIAAGDDARTVFRLAKPSGWPAGAYRLRVLHNGRELESEEFEVKE